MRNLFATLGLVTAVLLCAGTTSFAKDDDNRDKAKRVFLVSDFSSVSVSSGIDLYLQPSTKNEAVAFAPKSMMDDLIIERHGSQLVIRFKNGFRMQWGKNQSVKVYLSFKELNGVNASGGSDVEMAKESDFIKAKEFKINASGGSDIEMNLNVESLYCETSGGSDVELIGNANYAKINASGGSDYKGSKFKAKECDIHTSGGSDAYVYASERIKAEASGASDIYYYGNPKQSNVVATGASDIYRK